MRIKEGYVMKKLGMGHVVVAIGDAAREFNGIIRLNDVGAFLWESILNGTDSKKKLVDAMLERYENLDEAAAAGDLDEFLDSVAFALEDY